MGDVQGDLVLRPDTGNGVLILTVVAAGGASIVAAILAGGGSAAFAWTFGALFAVVVLLGAAYQIRSRVVLTAHEIVVRGLVFRRRRPRSHAVEVVRATISAPRGAQGDNLFVLDVHRDVLVRVPASAYRRDDIDRLVGALGVPCTGPGRVVSAGEFAKEYPGLVSWVERHPYRLVFAIAAVVCAVALAVALVTTAWGA